MTPRQQLLLEQIRASGGGTFLHGAEVRVARSLEKLGLVKIEDYGAMMSAPGGRSDRERWWCTPTTTEDLMSQKDLDALMSTLAQGVINITEGLTTIELGSRVHRAMSAIVTLYIDGKLVLKEKA